jgi:hypothetical protein
LAKVLSSWGARLTWFAQRDHAAQKVKAVEDHKGASVFMSFAAIISTLPQSFVAVHKTMPQYSAAIYSNTIVGGQGFDKTGFDRAGGVMGLGPAGWAHLCAFIHYCLLNFGFRLVCFFTLKIAPDLLPSLACVTRD